METDTIRLLDFMEAVFARPNIFVPTGSFDEIAIFLAGYTEAVVKYASQEVRRDCLYAFGYWLSDTQPDLEHLPRNRTWSVKIRALYPEDATALREAGRLDQEFITDPKRAVQTTEAGPPLEHH